MKKALLNLLIVLSISVITYSQSVLVNSPASIAGTYPVFGTANFGPALTTGVWTADVVLIKDASSTPPSLGCDSLLLNSAALKGKIALIDRANCNFSLKVHNAQVAGAIACVVFNNIAGAGVLVMGSSAYGADDTIPSVMLPYEDGVKIKGELAKGPVNMTIGNIVFPNDLATNSHGGICNAPYGTYPISWLRNLGDFDIVPGANIKNRGLNNGTGVKLNAKISFTPDGGSATEFYNQTSSPGIVVEKDSTYRVTLASQDLLGHASGTGKGTINYLITSDSSEISTTDNLAVGEFYLSNDIFSKGRLTAGSRDPYSTNAYTLSSGVNAEYLIPYNIPYCKDCTIDSVLFFVTINPPATLANVVLAVSIYVWNDLSGDGAASVDEIYLLSATGYLFDPSDTRSRVMVRIPMEDFNLGGKVKVPEDNFKIFVGIRNPNSEQTFIGFDEGIDHGCRVDRAVAAGTITDIDYPYILVTTWDNSNLPDLSTGFLFGNGDGTRNFGAIASSITLSDLQVGNNQLSDLDAKVNLYPNPAKDKLQVDVTLDEATSKVIYNITDNNGKLLFQHVDNNAGKEYKAKFNVSNLANGLYHLVLRTDKGFKNSSFEVLK